MANHTSKHFGYTLQVSVMATFYMLECYSQILQVNNLYELMLQVRNLVWTHFTVKDRSPFKICLMNKFNHEVTLGRKKFFVCSKVGLTREYLIHSDVLNTTDYYTIFTNYAQTPKVERTCTHLYQTREWISNVYFSCMYLWQGS